MIKINIKKLPKSEVEIEGELEAGAFENYFQKALKKIGKTLKLDGFRSGKIPESVLLSKVPEIRILEEMAELALSEYYPKILEDEKIDAISHPQISLTKLARKNPLGFKIKTAVLPEVKLPAYKDMEDFKEKLKINIKLEKENQNKEKTRLKIIEDIVEKTEIDLPEILVELELDKILHRMESDITQMGLKFEDYLKHLNKTVENLRKDFRTDAEKKAKLTLALSEIAKAENITADAEQVAKEVAAILEHYKEADPERAEMHAQQVLTNEKIFQFLESQ